MRRKVRIPTRDGLFLAADHYRPASNPMGTVLIRGPYGRRFPLALGLARLFAARGYHAVFVSSRGTHGSQGCFRPMETELDDGLDVTAWLVTQPWFEGRFATIGPSYLGFTQWAVGADGSTEVAMVPVFHRVRAGHRIRLLIAGGSFPRFDRNLGTGEPPGLGVGM